MLSKIFIASLVLFGLALFLGCEGETGPTGPQGPPGIDGQNGQDGQDGLNGQDGQDGNANVIMFEYGSRTTSTGQIEYVFDASTGLVDSSFILAYSTRSTDNTLEWYPVPGLGFLAQYMTRAHWYYSNPGEYTYRVSLLEPDGSVTYTNDVTFTRFRIFLVPASSIIQGKSLGLLDITDYGSVRKYFDLKD